MKIATSIVVVTLTLAFAADAATHSAVGATQVPEKYRNSDNSATWPGIRAIQEKSHTTMEARDSKIQGKRSGATTTYPLEYHDKLLRQQARENKINALNRRCDGNNSPLCRKHNDRHAER